MSIDLRKQKQRAESDCALACIASLVARNYDDIWPAEFLEKVAVKHGTYGEDLTYAFTLAGLTKGEDYKVIYLPESWSSAPQVKSLLFGRRALMQVVSLNYPGQQHLVYWDGRDLFDPSEKQVYRWLSQCAPSHIWVFDEVAQKGGTV